MSLSSSAKASGRNMPPDLDDWLHHDTAPQHRNEVLRALDAQARAAERLIAQGVTPRRRLHLNRFHAACGAALQVLRQTWKDIHQPH